MSHFTVAVFGEEDLDAALAPFDGNLEVEPHEREISKHDMQAALRMAKEDGPTGRNPSPERLANFLNKRGWRENHCVRDGKIMETTTRNPKGHWDWWVLGGRWRGFFPLKPGVTYDMKWHLGEPGTGERLAMIDGKGPFDNYEKKRKADRLYLKNIDFERCAQEAETSAREDFAKWRDVFAKHPRPTGRLETLRNEIDATPGSKRHAYYEQPAIMAYRDLPDAVWGCPVDTFGFDEKAYVKLCIESALVPYAVIHNGEWIGHDSSGWSGSIHDPSTHRWNQQIQSIYKSLPVDTIVSLVDCHN